MRNTQHAKQCMIPGLTSCLAKEKWCLNLDLSHRVSSGEGVGGTQQIEKSTCLTSVVSSLCIDPWLFSSWRTDASAHAHYTCPSTELRPASVFRSPKVFFIFPVVLSLTCGFRGHQSMSLPLHLWPVSSVLKRIPFRLQAVRVVFCCSRLQLSVFPQVPASLAYPISFSAF